MTPFKRSLLVAAAALVLPMSAFAATPAAPAKPAAPKAVYPEGKLPDAVTPLAYRLHLTVVPDQERFSGHAEIDITNKKATKSLFIHGRDLKVGKAEAIVAGKSIAVTYTQLDPLGVSRVDFAEVIPAGPVTLKFDYDAPFGEGPSGLYHVKVGDDWYAWTQFESIDARAAYPSFDEPGYKTPFTVSLTTKDGFTAVSNAPETGTKKDGDLVEHDFAVTKPLPTYLVAMVVGPFVTANGVAPPTPQRPYPLPIQIVATKPNAAKMDYVLKETPSIVAHLEAYFNMPFPYPKLSQIASPIMPGAMENAGADVYGDNIIMLDPGASTGQKKEFGMVVAHELSHQWFGDYVTPAWWDDTWLNESFANWMGYRIGNEWRPELNIGVGALDEGLAAMNTDALKVGRPIHQPILKNGEIDSAFDGITYGKGGQVVAMIAAYLGDDKFRAGVRLHMSRHPYGNANSEQFFGALADAAKDPRVLTSMKSFVNQQGFPVVDITHSSDKGAGDKLVATQSRYARIGTALAPQSWTIPLCIRHGDTRTCTLMDKKTEVVAAPGSGVIMPNAGGTGYYRFNLPDADWKALIATGDTLPAPEGLSTIDSLWGQFYAGKGPVDRLIEAARVMVNNPDSNVATGAGDNLANLRRRGMISDATLPDYRRVMGEIYVPRLKAMGFDPKAGVYAGDDPDKQELREGLMTLAYREARDPEVRKALGDAANAYLGGDKTAVSQALLGAALAVHVQDGKLPAAKDMYERLLATKDEGFRSAALRSVTSGADADTADWVFSFINTDKRMRKPDKFALIAGLMGEPSIRDKTFAWVMANYDAVNASAGIFTAGRLAGLPSAYCSVAKADEIDRLMRKKVEADGRSNLSFNRMLEGMRDCGALETLKGAEISAAFKAAK